MTAQTRHLHGSRLQHYNITGTDLIEVFAQAAELVASLEESGYGDTPWLGQPIPEGISIVAEWAGDVFKQYVLTLIFDELEEAAPSSCSSERVVFSSANGAGEGGYVFGDLSVAEASDLRDELTDLLQVGV